MTIRLHCFGESGHSYKAALALELAGLDWTPVKVDFFGGQTRSDTYRNDINPMGEVPTLEDGDVRLSQSAVIQQYLSDTYGHFGGATSDENRQILRWQFWDNGKLSALAGFARFQGNFVPEDKRSADLIAFFQGRLQNSYAILDKHLDGRGWMVGDAPTNADLTCCGYLYYPEPFGFSRADWPNIDAWLGRIAALPGWKHPYDLMPGNPSERA